jgi:site-specific DNA recombinase
VIFRLDRLSRRVKDLADLLEEFERRDVKLASVTESIDTASAGGRLVLNVLVVVAQWERDTIAERTSAAMARLREAGRRVWNAPYALEWRGDDLRPVPHELAVVHEMRALRGLRLSFSAIARQLNEAGHRTRAGTPWSHSGVSRVLRNDRGAAACSA